MISVKQCCAILLPPHALIAFASFELVRLLSPSRDLKVFCYATSLLVEGAKRGR